MPKLKKRWKHWQAAIRHKTQIDNSRFLRYIIKLGVGIALRDARILRRCRHLEPGYILWLLRQNADAIRGKLCIVLNIGTDDVLACDNEIINLYLDSQSIPHEYNKFDGVAHQPGRNI